MRESRLNCPTDPGYVMSSCPIQLSTLISIGCIQPSDYLWPVAELRGWVGGEETHQDLISEVQRKTNGGNEERLANILLDHSC